MASGKQRTGMIRNYRVGDIFSDDNSELTRANAKPEQEQAQKSEQQEKEIITRDSITLDKGLKPFLNPQTRQVNAPHRIPAEVLRPYLQHNKNVVFLHSTKRPVTAKLSSIQSDHLTAEIDNKVAVKLLRWKGEPVAVLFQTDDQQRYLLQTQVEEIFTTEVTLSYIDPLYTLHFPDGWNEETSLSVLPPDAIKSLDIEGATFERKMTWSKISNQKQLKKVADLVELQSAQIFSSRPGAIHDISLGGMSLTIDADAALDDQLVRQIPAIVRIQTSLPFMRTESSETTDYEAMCLSVLAVTLNILRGDTDAQVHCGFIQPIPDVYATLFQSLQPDQMQAAA